MIEDRLGEDGILRFHAAASMRNINTASCAWPISSANWNAYTGRTWQTFFEEWLYGKGMSDWSLEKVHVDEWSKSKGRWQSQSLGCRLRRADVSASSRRRAAAGSPTYRVTVDSETEGRIRPSRLVLGFSLDNSANYHANPHHAASPRARGCSQPRRGSKCCPANCVRVEVELPCEPTQIAVDPDQVLLDRNPDEQLLEAADPHGGRRRCIRSWTRST